MFSERKEEIRGAIPPSFVKTIQDASTAVGQLVRLDAIIAGSKPLDVYWLKVNSCLNFALFQIIFKITVYIIQ